MRRGRSENRVLGVCDVVAKAEFGDQHGDGETDAAHKPEDDAREDGVGQRWEEAARAASVDAGSGECEERDGGAGQEPMFEDFGQRRSSCGFDIMLKKLVLTWGEAAKLDSDMTHLISAASWTIPKRMEPHELGVPDRRPPAPPAGASPGGWCAFLPVQPRFRTSAGRLRTVTG
jgi:hypothetical protein